MKIYFKNIIYILILLIASPNLNASYNSLDEFDDLELEALDYTKTRKSNVSDNKQRLILFDDNLYLLDDDFDFGSDEVELRKLELNPSDMETAREYEDFLNIFFENSMPLNNSLNTFGSSSYQNQDFRESNPNNSRRSSRSNYPKNTKSKANRDSNSGIPRRSIVPGKLGFGVSTILGTTIPMGQNLKGRFSSGSNIGIHFDTPYSFKLGNMDGLIGSDIFFSSMSAIASGESSYKLTNITGTISLFPMKSIEVKTGLGFSPSSIGDYSSTLISIPADLNYYLPMKFGGFQIALNLHAQLTLGYPNDGTVEGGSEATSEFINAGILIKTPFTF